MLLPGLVTRQGSNLLLSVRLTPKAAHDRVDGAETRDDGRAVLKVRVRAVPDSGRANEALLQLLARSLSLPGRSLTLASGSTSRVKVIRIADPPPGIEDRILALAGAASP